MITITITTIPVTITTVTITVITLTITTTMISVTIIINTHGDTQLRQYNGKQMLTPTSLKNNITQLTSKPITTT